MLPSLVHDYQMPRPQERLSRFTEAMPKAAETKCDPRWSTHEAKSLVGSIPSCWLPARTCDPSVKEADPRTYSRHHPGLGRCGPIGKEMSALMTSLVAECPVRVGTLVLRAPLGAPSGHGSTTAPVVLGDRGEAHFARPRCPRTMTVARRSVRQIRVEPPSPAGKR